jgi:hypothetical protein
MGLLPACLITSAPPDGEWAPTTRPCVPVGAPKHLMTDSALDHFVIGGDTILFGSRGAIKQMPVTGGEPEIVALAYREGPFGLIDDNLVYEFFNESVDEEFAIGVVLDRGNRAPERYEILTPPAGTFSLISVIEAGVYVARVDQWKQLATWRWSPDGGLAPFDLAGNWIASDGVDFFYQQPNAKLVIKPVTGGTPQAVVTGPSALPAAVDADHLWYSAEVTSTRRDLFVKSRRDGTERVAVAGLHVHAGKLAGGYFYWSQLIENNERSAVFRVPVAGGPVATIAESDHWIVGIATDECNIYWRNLTPDTRELHARSH